MTAFRPSSQAVASTSASGIATDVCAHCGDGFDRGPVVHKRVGGVARRYCCQGCAFIAEQIELAHGARRDLQALEDGKRPAIEGSQRHLVLTVHGMVCAACALLIESRLRALPGVARAHVDFAGRRASIAYDAARTDEAALRAALAAWGYATDLTAAQSKRATRLELARVLVAWLVMMQVMMLAFPAYVAAPGEIAPDVEQVLRIAQLVLALAVVLFSAAPILRAALNQWRAGAIGMDVPIVLGLGAAFGASLWATAHAAGAVYFDSITMFVALVSGSRWVQAQALARARRVIDHAAEAATLIARRLRFTEPDLTAHDVVPASILRVGEQVWVPAGEVFPADGLIVSGSSSVSQAWLLGEARPTAVQPGAGVLAGSVNLEQPVTLEVTRAGEATALAALRRLAERVSEGRPRIVEAAHRIAVAFLWLVLATAAATLLFWGWIDPTQLTQRALPNVIAVLIATCPCALSLAAPATWSVAQAALARRGVLVARISALEALAHIDTLVLDKTGTVTSPQPTLRDVVMFDENTRMNAERALAIAASLDSATTHPFAQALTRAAAAAGVDVPLPMAVQVTPGHGVEASIQARRYRLGSTTFALALIPKQARTESQTESLHAALARYAAAGQSVALLAEADGPIALFVFDESLREGAVQALQALRAQGLDARLLSGDRRESVQRVAAQLGMAPDGAHAEQRPQDKRDLVATLQKQGRCVAMLGDGLNDAPVLAQANVSLAMGSTLGGSALAQTNADFIVLHPDLRHVAATVVIARRALAIVQQNFTWALVYNLSILPLAAAGFLTPAWAAVGMAASSLLVVGNAMRLMRQVGRHAVPNTSHTLRMTPY